jgi:hypothetical protein
MRTSAARNQSVSSKLPELDKGLAMAKGREFKSVETSKYKDNQNQRDILEMMGQVSNKSKLQESVQSPLRQGKTEDRTPAASTRKKVSAVPNPSLKLSVAESQTFDSAEDYQHTDTRTNSRPPLRLKRSPEDSHIRADLEELSSPAIAEGDSGLAELQSPLKRPAKKKTLIRVKKPSQPPRAFENNEE